MTPWCRDCPYEDPADGLDGLCTPCRAEAACTGLTNDLTNALESFLDARWSPQDSRGHYYPKSPAFDGDPLAYQDEINAAYAEVLIELAVGRRVRMEETGVEYYLPDDFDGFHACVEWFPEDETC